MDVIVGSTHDENYINHVNIDKVNEDEAIFDVGMKTVNQFKEIIDNSATIFVNGTAGKYEDIKFATGTREILTNIANSRAIKVVGGGDGVSAVKHFKLAERFNFLSTGGGATLEYIINKSYNRTERNAQIKSLNVTHLTWRVKKANTMLIVMMTLLTVLLNQMSLITIQKVSLYVVKVDQ